ncbi:hypothetical protein [Polaribacter cellanae]|uniref:Uncharacterized protein n=1 Tax=Polaribacter cellanae TaxID=2818493 RepID=A0A975H6R2_9FLAO|nr:hypothetical protein [Polaribacter cellanae]QTE22726.1 hypothetical protein J3359_00135 [Polaribacter cellanae]
MTTNGSYLERNIFQESFSTLKDSHRITKGNIKFTLRIIVPYPFSSNKLGL